jgi:dTDP-glucose 4,6-dehydratase
MSDTGKLNSNCWTYKLPKKRMNMRIIVTGGAGFLGSHLVDALLAEGHDVVAVDNLLTGRMRNIAHLEGHEHFTFLNHDVCKTFDPGRFDFVYHLASPASPFDYLEFGPETLCVGSIGTMNVLELARSYGAGLLLASTSECYGDPSQHPQTESYWGNVNPVGPRSVYDESKRFAEAATMAWNRYYGVDTKIVRIFNTYGPRLQPNDGRVISTFIRQALKGEDITIFGDGSQTRSFCFVSDEIDGLMKLAKCTDHMPVNIGNPTEFTIRNCAEIVLELTGSASRLVFTELPEDDPKQRKPDISRAQNLLGWRPLVNLRTGLSITIASLAAELDQEVLQSTAN